MTILINIASYRDKLLWDTVNDCLSNADYPDDLRFAIVDQNKIAYKIKSHPNCKLINYFHFSPELSRGPCWARSLGHGFYNGEDYVLQIDSHTVFDKGWDTILINSLNECQLKNYKSVITTYPPAFEFVDGVVRKQNISGVIVLGPKNISSLKEDNPSFDFIGYVKEKNSAVKGCHIAGGFIFAPGNFFQEIPYDPSIYFLGEEQNIATRAWTNGWDIYHVPNIPVYHLYNNKKKKSQTKRRKLHWDESEDKNRLIKWHELHDKSRKKLCQLFFENKDLGIYGLGKVRTLQEFEEFSGINYTEKIITFNFADKIL